MTIKTYSSNDEAFLDLKAGRVDALLADGYSGRYYLTTLSSSENIYASIDSGFEKSYAAVGLRKEDTALKADIDGALSELISNGTASDISRTWFGEDIIVK
jgi:polar amino acid transport system substrate-binding protein